MGAGSSVDMANAGLELPDGGPPPPGADAEFDALVEAEMRKRSPGTEPGIAPPPPGAPPPARSVSASSQCAAPPAHGSC